MPLLSDRQSVAANSVVQNVLSGKSMEFLQAPSAIRAGVVAATTGLFATLLVGDEVIVEDQEVSNSNRYPIEPDDFLWEAVGLRGDRLVIKLRNSTAAAIVAFTAVKVVPVG